MAGNGGQMAEIKQKQKRAETGTTAKQNIEKKKKPSVKQREKKEKEVQEAVADGIDTLRKAVGKELIESGGKIAEKLRKKSEEGDVSSTKLLVELAKQTSLGKIDTAKKKKSMAKKYATEKEWAVTASEKKQPQ